MQEEALKKHDEKAEVKPVPQAAVAKSKRVKRRVAKVQRAEPHAPEVVSLPSPLRPIFEQPTSYDALASLPPLPMATVFSLATYRNSVTIQITKSRKQKRRRAAAFLLLAA
jgi:hypothetical protein